MIAEKGSGYELESSSSRQCGRRALKWRRLLGVAGLTPTKYDIEVITNPDERGKDRWGGKA